jgi:hypothetical protein
MKTLLAVLFCLLVYTACLAQSWPRNPQTSKVEFRGTLKWPVGIKTEVQKQALVRKWYLAKLTSMSATAVKQEASTAVSKTLLTYADLPNDIIMRYGQGPGADLLAYQANLLATPKGLSYTLSGFDLIKQKDVQGNVAGTPLEQIIDANIPAEQPGLSALRKRLATAVAGW